MKFKAYKQKNVVTITPDNIANQLVTAYSGQTLENLEEHGEVLLDTIAHSSLDNFNADTQGIINALYYLNYRLEAVRKTISFWDAYQIRETVDDRDTLLGQLANLPPNSSVVSNLRMPFKWLNNLQQEETVYRGDLFIKDYQGKIHLIHGTSQGTYEPQTTWDPIEPGSSTYKLVYKYTESPVSPINTQLTLSGQPQGYNNTFTIASGDDESLAMINVIKPVVKYYISQGDLRELVVFDESFAINNSIITLSNPTSVSLFCEVK